MNTKELREMSDEQLTATLAETVENLFRLRIQAQTERLDAPSELRRSRRSIARIKTEQRARTLAQPVAVEPAPTPDVPAVEPEAEAETES
jgi:large subunit ribosomal protein L29